MKRTIQMLSLSLFMAMGNLMGQGTEPYVRTTDDDNYVQQKYLETAIKMFMLIGSKKDPKMIRDMAKNYALPGLAFMMGNKNAMTFNDRDEFAKSLAPEESEQGTFLETIYDRELMRDVDQYVEIIKATQQYGLGMVLKQNEISGFLAPEKYMDDIFVTVDTAVRNEATYGGLTSQQYQVGLDMAYDDLVAFEPSGDDAQDLAALQGIITENFGTTTDNDHVLDMVLDLMGEPLFGTIGVDDILVQSVVESNLADLEADPVEEQEAYQGTYPDVSGDGDLTAFMGQIGAESRNVVERYGDIAEREFVNYVDSQFQSNEQAQEALTNIVELWEALSIVENAEKLIAIERSARQIVAMIEQDGVNGENIEGLFGYFEMIWNEIFSAKRREDRILD